MTRPRSLHHCLQGDGEQGGTEHVALLNAARGFQSVSVAQENIGVAATSCGIGKETRAVTFDLYEHLLAIDCPKRVAHIHLQEHFVGFGISAHRPTLRAAVSAAFGT